MPFTIHDNTDHPLTLYAASKKSNELMAHAYSSLFGIPTTGLRFFTVYGPFGRPDMAMFIFTKAILEGQPIDLFNDGKMTRDFTYVDDIVETVSRLVPHIATPSSSWDGMNPEPSTSFAPYRIYNVGNNRPVDLPYFVKVIEEKLGKKAIMKYAPIQSGDVPKTFAGVDELSELGYRPSTPVEVGVEKFIEWYINYYKIKK
jgi:UDP-glucuronate 4-epimerase